MDGGYRESDDAQAALAHDVLSTPGEQERIFERVRIALQARREREASLRRGSEVAET